MVAIKLDVQKKLGNVFITMKNRIEQKNIPRGWSLIPAGDVFTFVKSYAFSRDNLVNDTHNKDGIGNIHYGDIHSTFSTPSISLKEVSVPMIKDVDFVPKPEDLLKDGDLIMADASEDYAGVGVTVSLHGLESKKVVGGLHTFVLRDTKNKTDKYFRQYIFRNPVIRNSLQKVANGVAVYGISKTAVSKIMLSLPSILEQNRIVGVLETWDRAIEKLVKKIAIKKEIKKGLMQELLTGKTRLPGFIKNWETKSLGDCLDRMEGGGTPSKENASFWNGSIPWASVKDIVTHNPHDTQDHISVDGLQSSASRVVSKGTLIVPTRMALGYAVIFDVDVAINQDLKALYPKKELLNQYLFYWFKSKKESIKRLGSGSTVSGIQQGELKRIKILLPSPEEQTAIADILSTVDKETKELEQKLSLIKDQKKYLLNNLITGTIRTPENMKIKT